MWLELSVQQERTKSLPIGILTLRGRNDAVERIGLGVVRLVPVGGVEERVANDVAATERWLGAELLEHQLLHRVVEHPPAGTDAGLAGTAGAIGDAEAWR